MNAVHAQKHLTLQQQRYSLIAEAQETLDLIPGNWTFLDGETPWSLDVARGRRSDLCVDGVNFTADGSRQYSLALLGPAPASLREAVEHVREAWQRKSWSVDTIVPPSTGYYEIGTDTPDGISLSFGANADSVNVYGTTGCFADQKA